MAALPHYEFSNKYDPDHAKKYFEKHNTGFWRKLSNWREVGMTRKALELAGNPKLVLDLPCGTGRFWEMLTEKKDRIIYVADNSQAMIDTGMALRPSEVTARIEKTFECSAFATGLPNDFVDCVFCIRLLHHIEKSEDRVLMLKEFGRISTDTVIVSLWVDGNYKAYRHRIKQEKKKQSRDKISPRDRSIISRQDIEHDFANANLEIVGYVDFLKYWEKWRTYVLRVKKS